MLQEWGYVTNEVDKGPGGSRDPQGKRKKKKVV